MHSFLRRRVRVLHVLVLGAAVLFLLTGGDRRSVAGADQGDAPPGPPTEPKRLTDAQLPTAVHAVELATVGFDTLTKAPIVLLREPEAGTVVPIWVGMAEARAIAWALDGFKPPRPMTHDLMAALIKELDAELVDVVVDDLVDHTYHGKLKLRVADEKELRIVDTRPSDALALALRTGATIHVADKILEQTPKFDFLPPDESKQIVHALGLTVIKPTAEHRREYKLPDRTGVLVMKATGTARERGLRRGDLIVRVNDQTPKSPMMFFDVVSKVRAGSDVRLEYLREGKERDVRLPADVPAPEPPKTRDGPESIRI